MIEVLRKLGYYPRVCVWELTLACDMRCRHCASIAGGKRSRELSPDEALDIADQLGEMHCERLTLSGGEPTLRADWDTIGARCVSRGIRVNLISNGWSWTEDHARKAAAAGLENVGFSLDGLEAAHDTVRARDGSFRRVMAALASCEKAGVKTSVVSHINNLNKHSLPELRAQLADHGVRSWQVQMGNPGGEMANNAELVAPPSDLLWLVPLLAEMCTDGARPKVFPADNIGYYGKYEKVLRDRGARICFWIGCRAGCQVLGIESDGTLKGCLSLPSSMHNRDEFVEGNLRDKRLSELWARPGAFAYNREFDVNQLKGFCSTCRFRDICRGGCSWSAYTRTGSRFDNPLCFYRVAVENKRWDLIDDAELDIAESGHDLDEPSPMG